MTARKWGGDAEDLPQRRRVRTAERVTDEMRGRVLVNKCPLALGCALTARALALNSPRASGDWDEGGELALRHCTREAGEVPADELHDVFRAASQLVAL
jgi:hypothetical protein